VSVEVWLRGEVELNRGGVEISSGGVAVGPMTLLLAVPRSMRLPLLLLLCLLVRLCSDGRCLCCCCCDDGGESGKSANDSSPESVKRRSDSRNVFSPVRPWWASGALRCQAK